MKPSRYLTFSRFATSIALVRLVSGIGITTSTSLVSCSRWIFSTRRSPIRRRALCTEIRSMSESGRAKYTYSKMQGVYCVRAAHWRATASSP